ncbi:MAG: hypothetical protein [Bacteriophage sp.]|nr:MAG: hypothetical protein [Bacteriophage sp.]
MDNNKDAVYIQQLRKYCKDNKKWNEIFPVTFIQAIYNAANGNRLDTLLAMYNSIFVEYKGSFATTVAAIDNIVRKKGLIITYFDENNLSWTRRYKLHDVSDINFQNEDNWEGYNFDILIDEIYKAIEYVFNNIDKFPNLKNVLMQQITEVTENIFNNIEDYANLYNIFKNLIKENINNVFNNINDYNEFKNLINTNINNRVDYIFNNIDNFKILLNKINVAILNRVDYIFNNINKYPELKQLIINSLQTKQLFTIEFSVNGDTLDIINKDELNSYIENNNINNNALVTFIGKFFDASNNKLIYNLVFTAFVNTSSAYLNLDNCYGETLIINDGKLYKYKINFNIDTKTPINSPNWITNIRKYDDIPTIEFDYVSTNIYVITDIDAYYKYINSFKNNTLVRFIFNESSTIINEYIGYINKVGSTVRILIYLQESNDFVYDTIISGIIENNKLQIRRLSNSDILTHLYNANSSGGVVLLDDDTLIPSRFLPSYVDDVIDLLGGIVKSTPTSGMTAGYKYYVTSTKKIFTASSATSGITSDPISDVIYVVPDDINRTIMYRWSGTTLVEIINGGIVIGTTTGTAFDGARGLNNENILKSVPNKLITDVSVIARGPNDDVIIRTTYSERTNNNGSYTANKYKDYQLPEANQTIAGLMSGDDKTKLDSIYIVKLTGKDLTSNGENGDINNTDMSVSDFNTLLESLNDGKNVRVFIAEYNDGAKQTFNINCDIAFNYNTKRIYLQYDIYDLNKRFCSVLYTYNNTVVLEIETVKDKYTKFYYIDSNTLYNPTKGKTGNLSTAQFSIQQFDELVSDIQKRKDFCVYSTVFTSKNSDVKYYRYNINCIVNSDTQLLCNYVNPLDNSYIKFTMNKLTANVQIVINEKYNIINTTDVLNPTDVLNTVMSGLVLKPTSGNQFETNQRYSSSDTLIQLINKFIQNSGYNDFRIVHSATTINFVFGTTINNSNPIVNVLSFASDLIVGAPVLRIYSKSIDFSEVATLTYTELDNTIRDGSWRSFELDLSNIGSGGSDYTLPIASATTLGGIKIPANGQMTIDKDGNLYPNAATSVSAGIVRPSIRSGLFMNGSSISVTLGRKDINLGTLTPGSTINGGRYYIYDDAVVGNASPAFNLNNKIDSWNDPLAIIIVNRKNIGGMYFKGTNINMLTNTYDCTKIGAVFIRYFQNNNGNGYFVWAVPNVI